MSSKNTISVFINCPEITVQACKWWCQLFFAHFNLEVQFVFELTSGSVELGFNTDSDIYVSPILTRLLTDLPIPFGDVMDSAEPIIRYEGRKDYVSTTFYLVNSLQEYHADTTLLDELGRFDSRRSLQYHYNCLDRKLVSEYFRSIVEGSSLLKEQCVLDESPSTLSLSYDIDFVRPAFLESLKSAFNDRSIKRFANAIKHEFIVSRSFTGIDDIISLHKRLGISAIIYWLPVKGKQMINRRKVYNADYDINDTTILSLISELNKLGFKNGLHKSLRTEMSFKDEMDLLPFNPNANRNHFLYFRLPDHYDSIEKAGLSEDSSLGYSDCIGFRNSYDKPFRPFNISENRTYNFIEKPITIMDVALLRADNPLEVLSEFMSKNSRNTQINVNWHNSSFWHKGTTDLLINLINLISDI